MHRHCCTSEGPPGSPRTPLFVQSARCRQHRDRCCCFTPAATLAAIPQARCRQTLAALCPGAETPISQGQLVLPPAPVCPSPAPRKPSFSPRVTCRSTLGVQAAAQSALPPPHPCPGQQGPPPRQPRLHSALACRQPLRLPDAAAMSNSGRLQPPAPLPPASGLPLPRPRPAAAIAATGAWAAAGMPLTRGPLLLLIRGIFGAPWRPSERSWHRQHLRLAASVLML